MSFRLQSLIRDIPDFPKPGITFKDIMPLLQEPGTLARITQEFARILEAYKVTHIAATEARGYIFGAPLAMEMGVGFVAIRKPGKLPFDTVSQDYQLEYGEGTLEVHQDAVTQGDKVVMIDDLLATGGTLGASIHLMQKLGAEVVAACCLIELSELKGRELLAGVPFYSLMVV